MSYQGSNKDMAAMLPREAVTLDPQTIRRYEPSWSPGAPAFMIENATGAYVRFEAFELLGAKLASVEADLTECRNVAHRRELAELKQ